MSVPPPPDVSPAKELEQRAVPRAALLLCCLGIPSVLYFLTATVLGALTRDAGGVMSLIFPYEVNFGYALVSLSALWGAFGPFRLWTRMPLAILMALLAVAAVATFFVLVGMRVDGVFVAVFTAGLQWMGLVMLLILARLAFRTSVAIPGTQPHGNPRLQFGIRHLLLLTTGVALVLGAWPFVAGQLDRHVMYWRFWVRQGIGIGLFNLLPAISLAWALLAARNVVWRVALAILVIVLGTLVEPTALSPFLGRFTPRAEFFWWTNSVGSICLVVNLLIVRLCGYRLVRDGR